MVQLLSLLYICTLNGDIPDVLTLDNGFLNIVGSAT